MSDQPKSDTLLDIVLASYRDMFGAKTERGNEIHRAACAEVARLRESETSLAITSSLLEERERQLDEAAEIFERLKQALENAANALSNAQGEWSSVSAAYAPEWTHELKNVESECRAVLEKGEA